MPNLWPSVSIWIVSRTFFLLLRKLSYIACIVHYPIILNYPAFATFLVQAADHRAMHDNVKIAILRGERERERERDSKRAMQSCQSIAGGASENKGLIIKEDYGMLLQGWMRRCVVAFGGAAVCRNNINHFNPSQGQASVSSGPILKFTNNSKGLLCTRTRGKSLLQKEQTENQAVSIQTILT